MKDRKEYFKNYAYKLRRKPRSGAYSSWYDMKKRCKNPLSIAYKNYGGRGIMVCDRWLSFENFLFDMGPRPFELTLDRIDNDGNYEKDNCRWASRYDQRINRRATHFIEAFGQKKPLVEWAKSTGIARSLIKYRIYEAKWDVERALNTPAAPLGVAPKIFIEAEGKKLPLQEWCKLKNIKYTTLHRRYKKYMDGILTLDELLETNQLSKRNRVKLQETAPSCS